MGDNEIGVFLTCTGIQNPVNALAAVKELGLNVVQVQTQQLSRDYYSKEGAKKFAEILENYGIEAGAVCIVFKGESYTDWETVKRTVGFLPPETFSERLEYSKRCVDFAADIDVPIVLFHMGILPKDPLAGGYRQLQEAIRQVARYSENRGVTLALETGQETALELLEFINRVGEDVKVNFDGANFISYRTDEPLHALHVLEDLIVNVHVKDTSPSGSERLGEGKAEVCKTVRNLIEYGYTGPFIMEIYVWRKYKTDPLSELRKGKAFLEKCLAFKP